MKYPFLPVSKLKYLFLRLSGWNKPYVFVAMGDSIIEGLGATSPEKTLASITFCQISKKSGKKSKYINLGKSGATVNDVLENQLEDAVRLKPDFVLISVGPNDVSSKTRPSLFAKRYSMLLKEVSKTGAVIVVNNIPDLTLMPSLSYFQSRIGNILAGRHNRIIAREAAKAKAIHVDLYEQSGILRGFPEIFSKDKIHPSDLGYALWAHAVTSRVKF